MRVIIILLVGFLTLGCNKDEEVALPTKVLFSNTNTDFQKLAAQLKSNAGGSFVDGWMDTEMHSYTFEMNKSGKIYTFGYQSQLAVSNKTYLIELVDSASGTTIYSQSNLFGSTGLSYITLQTPISIVANKSYILKRTFKYTDATLGSGPTFIAPYLYNFSDIIGGGLRKSSGTITFPIQVGDMKITKTECDQRYVPALQSPPDAPLINNFIPFIDFAFTAD